MSGARAVYRHDALRRALAPQSVALVGATTRAGAFGDRVVQNLAAYTGRLHLINARYERIGDRPCYPNIAALPEVPDCAVITVARDAVEGVLEECIAAGVGGAIVFASGYAETGKADRAKQQQRLGDRAREAGIKLIGPNTLGVANYVTGAGLTFSSMPRQGALGPGAVGIISQSGALGFALSQAAERGVPVSHVLTSGNSCDVDVADYVAYLADDPACRSIALLFEGMATPLRLIEAAEIAWAADKPVVVYKIATGSEGAKAALSHTGSLAGAEAAYEAAFARAGIVSVDKLEALIETASFFAKAPPPRGPGVAVVATSGGAAIMAADKAELHGVPLPQPSAETLKVLGSHIPEFGSPRNPCDVTAQVLTEPESLRACAGALLAEPQYAVLVSPQAYAYEAAAARLPMFSELAGAAGKIICNVWLPEWLEGPGARETERDPNLALFRSMDRCFATLAAWQRRAARRAAPPRQLTRAVEEGARARAAALIGAAAGDSLTEREAKEVLALYGIPVVSERRVQSAGEAAEAAAAVGYPVALKVESPDILHKTEAGVVRLGLRDAGEVSRAYDEVMARAAAVVPAPRVSGVLVQPMIPPGIELVAGGRVDPLFGPLVLVGFGGVLVEVLKDTALAPAPVTQAESREMLEGLRGRALLSGFRGSPPVDLDRLADIVRRLSEFVADHAGVIEELDVNPLICAEGRIVAVDALIVRRRGAA